MAEVQLGFFRRVAQPLYSVISDLTDPHLLPYAQLLVNYSMWEQRSRRGRGRLTPPPSADAQASGSKAEHTHAKKHVYVPGGSSPRRHSMDRRVSQSGYDSGHGKFDNRAPLHGGPHILGAWTSEGPHGAVEEGTVGLAIVGHGTVGHGTAGHGTAGEGAFEEGAVGEGTVGHGAVGHGAVTHGAVQLPSEPSGEMSRHISTGLTGAPSAAKAEAGLETRGVTRSPLSSRRTAAAPAPRSKSEATGPFSPAKKETKGRVGSIQHVTSLQLPNCCHLLVAAAHQPTHCCHLLVAGAEPKEFPQGSGRERQQLHKGEAG